MPLTDSELASVQSELDAAGITISDLDGDNAAVALSRALIQTVIAGEETATALSRAEDELKAEKALALSRDHKPVVDPEALMDRADVTLQRIDLALSRGDIPPFIADRLRKVVKSEDGPNVVALSRSEAFDARPIDWALELFKDAKLGVQLGEVSGAQTLALSQGDAQYGASKAAERPNPYADTIAQYTGSAK